ncbi:MAG TPA: HupE/UreJ family protein [Micropepsaceae bacterium]|nr:HupE/UreJ family protein [Micropepsaceae bacterium]
MAVRIVLCRLALLLVAALTLLPAQLFAHDIPSDVTVQAFVKPDGHTLRVLVRLPLKSVMDIEFPHRERDFVDLARVDQSLRDAATLAISNNLEIYEGDRLLPNPRIVSTRMSLDGDRSFVNYGSALAHVTGPPLSPDTTIYWEQGNLDVLFEYPIQSDRSHFSIHAAFDRFALKVITALQFLPPSGVDRAYALDGDAGLVRLEPDWFQAASLFVKMGFLHILDGTDHLLFLLCLIIPFRRVRPLIPIVTAFTVAHSITLIASAYNYAPDVQWFPPLIETLIATSVFYMALENIVVQHPGRRWIITFLFGLVHGFGFSFGLQHTLQFAGSYLLTSLLSFNVGVELGQLLVLAVLVPLLNILFRHVVAERMGTIILSVIVAHTAWHWMGERFEVLRQFPWPEVTAASLASALGWLIVVVAIAAAAWLLFVVTQRFAAEKWGLSRLTGKSPE